MAFAKVAKTGEQDVEGWVSGRRQGQVPLPFSSYLVMLCLV